MWLIVFSLSPHSLHLISFYVLSIFALLLLLLLLLFSCEFCHISVRWGLSLESEWQQVSSGLQDCSHISGQSKKCWILDCLYSSSDLQLLELPFQAFEDRSKWTNYNWYHRYSHVLHSEFLRKVQVLVSLSSLLLLFYSLEFFTSALADSFSLESERQQVSSSLQESSQDSGCSQQCSRLDSLYPSANFQVLQAFY